MKSGNKCKVTRTEIKVSIRQSAPSHSLCSQPLSFSTAQYNTHLIGLYYSLPFLHDPSHTGSLTEFSTILKHYIFLLSPQNCRSSVNKFISFMLFQHKSYEPVHFVLLDFLYIWLTYL